MSSQNLLESGDHAPWFTAPVISGSSQFAFNTIAGRYVLLLFFGSAEFEAAAEALRMVRQAREHFDDECACFFGVSVDPQDEAQGRIARELPGIRFFLDYDRRVSSRFGAVDGDRYLPHWLLLSHSLQVMERFALDEGQAAISALQKAIATPVEQAWAPVISVPNVLELSLCRELIELYECNGGEDSGFMRDVNGQTVGIVDHSFKQRRDYTIENEITRRRLQARMKRRLFPAIERAFQFQATRMERYMVACYEASAGHFKPHRDNTTKGTAHRKFAVTINLNSTEYEGGNLRFPEFGRRTYRAPTGGAIVFSCSLLHEATPVTSGRRYAFLPFLYDEEAARVREANSQYLATGGTYKA